MIRQVKTVLAADGLGSILSRWKQRLKEVSFENALKILAEFKKWNFHQDLERGEYADVVKTTKMGKNKGPFIGLIMDVDPVGEEGGLLDFLGNCEKKGWIPKDGTGEKSDTIKPSRKFYDWEADDEEFGPRKKSEVNNKKKGTPVPGTTLQVGDELVVTGNKGNVKCVITGFEGDKGRLLMAMADDGYVSFDLITNGDQIKKATRNGKPVPKAKK